MYSQNDEERVILDYFKGHPPGWLLDVGAYDGITFSNTRALMEAGWRGVFIEPSPFTFPKLFETYGDNDKAMVINAAMHPEGGFRHLWTDPVRPYNDTTDVATAIKHKVGRTPFTIRTFSPCAFRREHRCPFEMVSIDAEGIDFQLLEAMAYANLLNGTRLIVVEFSGQPMRDWAKLLYDISFAEIHRTPENIIARRL